MIRRTLLSLLALVALATPAAAQVTIPYSFTFETTIDQDQVNSNFTTIGNAALNRTGGTVTGAVTSSGGSITGSWAGSPTFSANPTFSGTPVFSNAVTMSGTTTYSGTLTSSGGTISGSWAGAPTFSGAVAFSGTPTFANAEAIKFTNTGLTIASTSAANALSIVPNEALTAGRTLNLVTGDATRTVTLSGNPTLNDWFDQSVKVASTPTFGATTVTGLLTISGASAGQIKFTCANASANVNTLDCYEEGTCTPVIGGAGGTSGQTYTNQNCFYTKVGKSVVVHGYVALSAKGTITGNLQLQGLPYAPATYGACPLDWQALNTTKSFMVLRLESGSTATTVFGISAAATSNETNLTTTDVTNTSGFAFSCAYTTAS